MSIHVRFTHDGERRYEVVCTPLVKSFNTVKSVPHVRDVTIFGNALHLVTDAAFDMARFEADVAPAGINVRDWREIQPSLEDVFVTLTKASVEAERHAAGRPAGEPEVAHV